MKATTTGVLTTLPVQVMYMIWTGPGAAGDSLVVVDSTGKDVWRAFAPSADYTLSTSSGERQTPVNGLNVTTISSGTLTIYYR